MDIAYVNSQTESPAVNGITKLQLIYKDSQGVQHVYDYSIVSRPHRSDIGLFALARPDHTRSIYRVRPNFPILMRPAGVPTT
ncbi:MAG: hypothetical protein ACOH2R_24675 [Pseudomonas sp.]